MYHVVLAAALMTAPASSNHCWHRAACHGCYSACSCYGGYAGYAGYAGHGYGCHGCYYGPVGYGCAGGCYGYHGGCYGGWGVFAGEAFPYHVGFAYGCYGGYAGYGVPLPEIVPPAREPVRDPFPPVNPEIKKGPGQEEVPLPKEKKKKQPMTQARATVQIDVPEGGKLYVDGQRIPTAAGTRTFRTPVLAQGETFFYDIRIEVERNGQVVSEERRVTIRAAQEVAVAFPRLTGTQVAGARK